jgi:transposase
MPVPYALSEPNHCSLVRLQGPFLRPGHKLQTPGDVDTGCLSRPHELRDDQWDLIWNELPGRADSVGVTAANNRRFVDAVIHRYRTDIPWRDLPESFGDWNNTHRRWNRWAKSGVWRSILTLLSTAADNEYAMIDSTIVRAHQHSAGAKKKLEKTRRSGEAKAA